MNRDSYDAQQDIWWKEYTALMDDEADLDAEHALEDEAVDEDIRRNLT